MNGAPSESVSDSVGQRPTMSDNDGHSPTVSDNVRQRPTLTDNVRRSDHTLTLEETRQLFESAGLPRSTRQIQRYCANKSLDSFLDPDERRYYISPGSVETLIKSFREINARHRQVSGQRPTASDNVGQRPDTSGHVRTEQLIARLETELDAKAKVIDGLLEAQKRTDKLFENTQILFKETKDLLASITHRLEAPKREVIESTPLGEALKQPTVAPDTSQDL